MSKKSKIMIIFCTILILGFVLTSTASYFVARNSLSDVTTTNTLPLTGNNIYSEIQRDLLKPIIISSFMAQDSFLTDWIRSGELEEQKVRDYLGQIQREYGAVTSFLISDSSKRYYHPNGVIATVSELRQEDAWYFEAKRAATSHQINIDFNPRSYEGVTVYINYKIVTPQGEFLGVTGVGLAINDVKMLIDQYQERYQREIFFIDKRGQVTLHGTHLDSDAEAIDNLLNDAQQAHILSARSSAFSDRDGADDVFINSRYVSEFGWYLVVKQRGGPQQAKLLHTWLLNLSISLLITLAVMYLLWLALGSYQKQLETMAITDKLTGLHNRQILESALQTQIKLSVRNNTPLSLVIFDIDNFKLINDTHGHPFGDKVLRAVADKLSQSSRDSDFLCRWGGEEFLLVLNNCDLGRAEDFTQKMQREFAAAPLTIGDQPIQVHFSAGIAQYHPDQSSEQMIHRADQALICAKNTGRNRVVSDTSNVDSLDIKDTDYAQ
ncbi:MAG: sensor domain-containing diguanylate cyclase [Pseudomonadales bacterium]